METELIEDNEGINADGSITIQLSKPIIVMGKPVEEITLREPTGKDYKQFGNILSFNSDGLMVFNPTKVCGFIEKLASLPANTLDQLPFKEINMMSLRIAPFLM
jgi:hypothetical protein